MNCESQQNLFSEYQKGSLSQEEAFEFEQHLCECDLCKTQWETYRVFFSDTEIEQDFKVPSQLNAKIKYTLQQAKNKKKIPFYRNKQVLSYATACCFLLVAGLFGTSHFEQVKETVNQPVLTNEAIEATIQNIPAETPVVSPETVVTQTSKQNQAVSDSVKAVMPTSAPKANQKAAELLADQAQPVEEALAEPQNEPAVAFETNESALEPVSYARHGGGGLPAGEFSIDFTVREELRSQILENYPHTELSENVYLVQITEISLEEILCISIDTEETKTEFMIAFIAE